MIPSIEVRIHSAIKALDEVILPAVDPDDPLAREQTQMVIGQLRLLADQWNDAHTHAHTSLLAMRDLAQALVDAADSGEHSNREQARLRDHLDENPSVATTPQGIEPLERESRWLGTAIDDLIDSCMSDGSPALRRTFVRLVARYGIVQSNYDRAYFACTELDPIAPSLR